MITGAQALIQGLEAEQVKTVFGYPGGAILPVYSELEKSGIQHILTRTEQGAAHAANAYSRVSGRVGVCMATSGPGATNLVTGLATAYMDSIPLVAITGQVSTRMIGTDAFQEVDITGITQPITKHNYLITNADDIPRIVKEAFYIARTGRPGPVLIDIPKNIAEAPCRNSIPERLELPGYKPTYKGHASQIKLACQALEKAQRPLIYAGGGVISSHAWEELLALAEKLQCPIVNTLMGKGAVPSTHPLGLGMLGLHGLPAANLAAVHCDVLLAVGVRFDDRVIGAAEKFAKGTRIIHVDIDPAEIGKNKSAHIPIVGDIKQVLTEMLERVNPTDTTAWLAEIAAFRQANLPLLARKEGEELTPWAIMDVLSQLVGKTAIVTTDVGQHQMAAAQFYQADRPGAFLTSGGLGTMGYGLPAALGAQMAAPDDLVVCISGDGSLQMSLNEMATIKAHQLPVKIILLNNECLGMVRQLQHTYCADQFYAVDMPGNPNFLRLAEAYGFANFRIEDPDDILPVLQKALANGQPTLIDCQVSKADWVLPTVAPGGGLDEMLMD